ncbi:Major cell-binding factor [Pseudomonas reidholzensis]|uniref:Major cell-binding factor n=1 Tax=Pseudomonas reidholzensis TaxID=1785162 RepID=A0A383RSL2_9PSED|nr:transporter substrate-binding domain-containing protein [Pseudomonas reidholzensis]SYX90042.1 Major cell-binding factor [Pseudomonas reidholzensis]
MSLTFTTARRGLLAALIASATLAGSVAAQADATLDKIEQRQRLSVGVVLSGGPFGAIDPATREPIGFSVDLARDLARQLNVKLELVAVQPANRVQFLQQGKVDLLIANMEWTPERDKLLGHVPTPFYRVGGSAALAKDSPVHTWAELKGQPVCTSQGSSYTQALIGLGAELKAFKTSAESLLALRGNNCVAAVHDATLINPLLAKGGEWSGYRALSPELNPAPSVIWTRLGEGDIQARLDPFVKQWHRSGWLIEREQANHITPASPALVELRQKLQGDGA